MKVTPIVIALVFSQASVSFGAQVQACNSGAACSAAKLAKTSKKTGTPIKYVAPTSRRHGHNDDFYKQGLKN